MIRLAVLLLVCGASARADVAASPLLPPQHWAAEAVARLDQLGLAGEWFPAQQSIELEAAAEAFERAEQLAATGRPEALALVRGWRARLAREFPGVRAGSWLLGGRITLGGDGGEARSVGAPTGELGAVRLEAPSGTPVSEVSIAARPAPWIAASVTGRADTNRGELPDADLAAAFGWFSLHAGRARPAYGLWPGTGVMLSGNATLDRVELLTNRPVRLPWILGHLGSWTADTFVARFAGSRWPDHPMLWATSLRWRMHPRLTVGFQRGILFGGTPWNGLSTSQRVEGLLGLGNVRENNMVTLSARWRLPTDAVLPLALDVEWGTDYELSAAVHLPGVVAVLTAPLAGPAGLSVAVESAWFGRACCSERYEPWYAHYQYDGGWVVGTTPLGDPLGGEGRALRLRAGLEPFDFLRVGATAWAQDRFQKNLYAPQAIGRSYGGRISADVRRGAAALEVGGSYERGQAGWSASDVALRASVFF